MPSPKVREARARIYLIALSVLVSIAACSATLLYSYPETFGALTGPMIVVHDLSGDLAIVVSGLYLMNHLARTWRIKRQKLSRTSGLVVVGLWAVASVTGIYGQLLSLDEGTWPWRLHFVSALATIVLVCFHGAWAFRPRKAAPRTEAEVGRREAA